MTTLTGRVRRAVLGSLLSAFIPGAALAQGFCNINEEHWAAGCEASCTAGWEGGNCPQTCNAAPPPGYIIVDYRLVPVSENNGGHSVSRIASDQKFDYAKRVEQAYNTAIEIAGKKGQEAVEAHLKDEMKYLLTLAENYTSSHELVRIEVNASKHGSFIDRKRGWSHMRVEILLKCMVPANLEEQLYSRYGLR